MDPRRLGALALALLTSCSFGACGGGGAPSVSTGSPSDASPVTTAATPRDVPAARAVVDRFLAAQRDRQPQRLCGTLAPASQAEFREDMELRSGRSDLDCAEAAAVFVARQPAAPPRLRATRVVERDGELAVTTREATGARTYGPVFEVARRGTRWFVVYD